MIRIDVGVALHTPTRIATGHAARGMDAVLDRDVIPASSLKGVMRAAGTEILGLETATMERLFGGSGGQPSPWAWSDIDLATAGALVSTRVRIPIDANTGVAAEGGLFLAEELWVDRPLAFNVKQVLAIADPEGDALLLAACAMSVKGIGAARRRGLGWATMTASITGRAVTAASAARAVASSRGVQR